MRAMWPRCPSGSVAQAMPGEASWRWQLTRKAVARSRVADAADDPGHALATADVSTPATAGFVGPVA
jgi:hypothetical protein